MEVVKQNIQILLETMTRCGGNCSGCALSSAERMDTSFNLEDFILRSKEVTKKLQSYNSDDIEAVTIFLGQGDHFLISEKYIPDFVKNCANMIPDEFKHKTVIFITASAIGKFEQIKKKMDLFYDHSVECGISFFIQTVFDPKKYNIKHFQKTYLQNILYFKEKCGMTELTLNLGNDLIEAFSPQELHDWVKEHQINHIEFNWVINQFTMNMWAKTYKSMHEWLQEWLLIYRNEPVYEINFLPFLARHFKYKSVPVLRMNRIIQNELAHNTYYDNTGNQFFCEYGFISNLTPFGKRLDKQSSEYANLDLNKTGKKILSNIIKPNRACADCEFNSVCSISASASTFEYWDEALEKQLITPEEHQSCPWGIKDFLTFFNNEIMEFIKENPEYRHMIETSFTKNPVQSSKLVFHNENSVENSTFEYFDACRLMRCNNE